MANTLLKTTAVYAGTFDPITQGHKDIIIRSAQMFEKLIVAIVAQAQKQVLFSAEERVALVKEALADVPGDIVVESFDALLVDYVKEKGAGIIIRGLRAVTDYEYEAQMALINRELAEDIETVFLMTSGHCAFVSSSVAKEVARFGGDLTKLVPPNVARVLEQKLIKR